MTDVTNPDVPAQGAVTAAPEAVKPVEAEAKQPTNADLLAAKQASLKADAAAQEPGKNPADPEPEPAEAKPEADNADAEDLAQTGDPVLDAGIKMMQSVAGLNSSDVERIMAKAYESGDSADIDSAFIKERFGEHAAYVEQLSKAYIDRTNEKVGSVVKAVHEAAGGAEQWGLMNETFKQHAPQYLQKAAQAMADIQDFMGASEVIIEFAKQSGMVPVAGQHIQGGGAVANGALSAKGFSEELAKLRTEAGSRSFESGPIKAKYDTLVRRRQAGRVQNI